MGTGRTADRIMKFDVELDARQLACPLPILRAKKIAVANAQRTDYQDCSDRQRVTQRFLCFLSASPVRLANSIVGFGLVVAPVLC